VGGGEHDWHTLLVMWSVVDRCVHFAQLLRFTGGAILALSAFWAFMVAIAPLLGPQWTPDGPVASGA
jgi:hypothetical protein